MTVPMKTREASPAERDPSLDSAADHEQLANLAHLGPIERASLSTLLEHLGNRLSSLESRLPTKSSEEKQPGKTIIELGKVLFGGWPAFGLVFLILFYGPLRDAINAIPEKVKSAEEIGVLGVSLKTSLRVEAEKIGAIQLSETLPALTPAAVELLLRASRQYNALTGYREGSGLLEVIWFPSEQMLSTLEELESKKLITVYAGGSGGSIDNPEGVKRLRSEIANFRRKYPGNEASASSEGEVMWTLTTPQKIEVPHFSWSLTDLGKKAVDVILKAVSSQLSPRSTQASKPLK